ncbi:MAG TPA: hypothetical protein VIR54_18765 [Vicinamibacterales bacterium]|jgi:hypothetical protein
MPNRLALSIGVAAVFVLAVVRVTGQTQPRSAARAEERAKQ